MNWVSPNNFVCFRTEGITPARINATLFKDDGRAVSAIIFEAGLNRRRENRRKRGLGERERRGREGANIESNEVLVLPSCQLQF